MFDWKMTIYKVLVMYNKLSIQRKMKSIGKLCLLNSFKLRMDRNPSLVHSHLHTNHTSSAIQLTDTHTQA